MARTSATGTERRAAGFSLVELLVVLVVLGLLGAAVLLTVPGEGRRLDDQAGRLAAHLQRAREHAVLSNRAVALRVDAEGYRFYERRLEGWREIGVQPFQARSFPPGISARTEGREPVVRFEFDALGSAQPAAVQLRSDAGGRRISLDARGEVALHATH